MNFITASWDKSAISITVARQRAQCNSYRCQGRNSYWLQWVPEDSLVPDSSETTYSGANVSRQFSELWMVQLLLLV